MRFVKVVVNSNSNVENLFLESEERLDNKLATYNICNQGKVTAFVTDNETELIICAIIENSFNFKNSIEPLIKSTFKDHALDFKYEEIRFVEFRARLFSVFSQKKKMENVLINSIDNSFKIRDMLTNTDFEAPFEENFIEKKTKREIYSNAQNSIVSEDFISELDRIYSKNQSKEFAGHPVHYIIQTSDNDTRKSVVDDLLSALNKNNRLLNNRYFTVNTSFSNSFMLADSLDGIYNICDGGAVVINVCRDPRIEEGVTIIDELVKNAIISNIEATRNKTLTILCFETSAQSAVDNFLDSLNTYTFVTMKEKSLFGSTAINFLKKLCKENNIDYCETLGNNISKEQIYQSSELKTIYNSWYNEQVKKVSYPQYLSIDNTRAKNIAKEQKGSAYNELEKLIGLEKAKDVINKIIDFSKAMHLYADMGYTHDNPSLHMCFTGNPGTAKTTVARLVGQILKENNILQSGHLIELGKNDLVEKYVGWTAKKIASLFEQARGGVLFIDEAYSLVDGYNGYGDEAINTIVQCMENYRNSVIVIFAGYKEQMQEFLNRNPGLKSRISFHVPFEDYDPTSLCKIAKYITEKKKLVLSADAMVKLKDIFEQECCYPDFGNGRFVRNIIERANMNHGSRLLNMNQTNITKTDVITITAEDIEYTSTRVPKESSKIIGFVS